MRPGSSSRGGITSSTSRRIRRAVKGASGRPVHRGWARPSFRRGSCRTTRCTPRSFRSSVPTGAMRAPGSNAIAFVDAVVHRRAGERRRQRPAPVPAVIVGGARSCVPPPPPADPNAPPGAGRGGGGGQQGAGSCPDARRARAGARQVRLGHAEAPAGHRRWASRSTSATQGYFAEVAEVAVDASKRVKVNKVWVAGDIGRQIINPLKAEAQAQGSRHRRPQPPHGLRDHHRQRPREQTNFDEYQPVRMRAGAAVRSRCTSGTTDNNPTGLGEPALPPILPAVCNAIFSATGTRVRSLPLSKHGFRWA